MIDGRTIDINFRSGDKVGAPDVMDVDMQSLYSDGEFWHFMNMNTYEQVQISFEDLGDTALYMKDEISVSVMLYNGRPIGVTLPNFVQLQITECEPGVRGDTAQGGTKPATLETGAVVNVPLFVNEGENIKVDTRTGQYVERVSS